jgi:hypothetical protein
VKILRIYFSSAISCAHAPGYFQTFISFCTFRFEQQKTLRKIDLCQLFCFDRFLPLFVFASRSLFFSSFDHETFEEVATVSYASMDSIFEFETEPKE